MQYPLINTTILLVVAGSRAYNLHTPSSDIDCKGVSVMPPDWRNSCYLNFEQADGSNEIAQFSKFFTEDELAIIAGSKLEGSIYELTKFIKLASDCNPNILDALFCREDEVRLLTKEGCCLREHRDLFLTAKAKHTFSGYAAAQLKRIRHHRNWLLNPPKTPPERADYGLPNHTLIPADQIAAANAAIQKQIDNWNPDFSGFSDSQIIQMQEQFHRYLDERLAALNYYDSREAETIAASIAAGLSDNVIEIMKNERAYKAAQQHWTQYQNWKSERNQARAELEAKYGYDTKHGAHLVRLLRMGKEILTTGQCNVWRTDDGDELRSIRAGAWNYDQLESYAVTLDNELTEIYRGGKYTVPYQPDREAIDNLYRTILEMTCNSI